MLSLTFTYCGSAYGPRTRPLTLTPPLSPRGLHAGNPVLKGSLEVVY